MNLGLVPAPEGQDEGARCLREISTKISAGVQTTAQDAQRLLSLLGGPHDTEVRLFLTQVFKGARSAFLDLLHQVENGRTPPPEMASLLNAATLLLFSQAELRVD
jgi:hypothetical protein